MASAKLEAGELDRAADLADEQLRRSGVDGAAAASGEHRVEAARRHVAERDRDRADGPHAVGLSLQVLDGGHDPARIGRLQADHLEAGVGTGIPRGDRMSVQGGALAAGRRELLAGAEVVNEAELDIGHRVAIGDRDRERVGGQGAADVHRAVDRIDDHPALRLTLSDLELPALLADREERVASCRSDLAELLEDDVLTAAVELQRHVAALAATLVDGPLGDGRRRREQIRLASGYPPAQIEPVDFGAHRRQCYWRPSLRLGRWAIPSSAWTASSGRSRTVRGPRWCSAPRGRGGPS